MESQNQQIIFLALQYRGAAFTFEHYFYYTSRFYVNFLGLWVKESDFGKNTRKTNQEKKVYLSRLPIGVVVSSQRKITSDSRTDSQKKFKYAMVQQTETLTISVPKELSQKLYFDHFSKIAYPFRDHLLTNQRDILNKINEWRIRESVYPLIVSQHDVANDVTNIYGKKLSFLALGMNELPGIAHCYGLALALTEVAGWDINDFIFIINNQYAVQRVEIRAKVQPIKLKQW